MIWREYSLRTDKGPSTVMKISLAVVLTLAPLPTSAAQKALPEAVRSDLNNFSADMQECFVYNTVASQCFGDKDPALKKQIFDVGQEFLKMSISAAKIVGISDKAILARGQIAIKSMMEDMDNDCINIAVILDKYAKSCKAQMEGSADRLVRILEKINAH